MTIATAYASPQPQAPHEATNSNLRHGRSLKERLEDADAAWQRYIALHRAQAAKGQEVGARVCMAHMAEFFTALTQNAALRDRAVQNVNHGYPHAVQANNAWNPLMQTARDNIGVKKSSPTFGGILCLDLAVFLNAIIGNDDLCRKLVDDLIAQIQYERPAEQGLLFKTFGGKPWKRQ